MAIYGCSTCSQVGLCIVHKRTPERQRLCHGLRQMMAQLIERGLTDDTALTCRHGQGRRPSMVTSVELENSGTVVDISCVSLTDGDPVVSCYRGTRADGSGVT